MAAIYQLDFFETKPERVDFIEMDANLALKTAEKAMKTTDNVRKGTYAQLNYQKKLILELREELDFLKRHICQTT